MLKGIRVIEFAGRGPGPFCGMVLADMGAEVIRIEPPGGLSTLNKGHDPLLRRRRRLEIDLKNPISVELVLKLIACSDALIEGNRPGVMERLGLGPDVCSKQNPRLVYGRVTGWGQDGPRAQSPGRDINYISLSGVLGSIGVRQPSVPLNLVGDFGGGGMLLALGVLAGVLHAHRTGQGEIVDASMVDGAALLMTSVFGLLANHQWDDRRAANLLDGGAPFYSTYPCADNGWIAIGAIDERSLGALFKLVGFTDLSPSGVWKCETWPHLRYRLESAFLMRERDGWCADPFASDACVSPVLGLREALSHPHNKARQTFVEVDGQICPAAAPRFSRHSATSAPVGSINDNASTILQDVLQLSVAETERLIAERVVR